MNVTKKATTHYTPRPCKPAIYNPKPNIHKYTSNKTVWRFRRAKQKQKQKGVGVIGAKTIRKPHITFIPQEATMMWYMVDACMLGMSEVTPILTLYTGTDEGTVKERVENQNPLVFSKEQEGLVLNLKNKLFSFL